MTTRADRRLASIDPQSLTEKAGDITEALKAIGLTIHDESSDFIELDADHRHHVIHDQFIKHGWRLTYNDADNRGAKLASYDYESFGGGKAVLHFKGNKIYFVTLNFVRNYHD